MKNTETRKLIFFFGVGVLAILIAILTDTFSNSGESAFGITFLSGFIGIALIVIGLFVFIPRYLYMKKMIEGKELIAAWELPQEDVLENAVDIKSRKKQICFENFVFIAVTCFITSIIFLFFENGEDLSFVMLAAILIAYIIYIFSPKIAYYNAVKSGKTVYIGKNAIYANGTYYSLKGVGDNCDNVKVFRSDNHMKLKYMYYSNIGKDYMNITVRIPKDNMEEVEKVINYYK